MPYRVGPDYDPGPGVDDSTDNMHSASYWWWRSYVRHFHWPVASMHSSALEFADWYSARWAAFHAGTGPRPRHLDREGWNYHYYVTRHGGEVPPGYLDTDEGDAAWLLARWHRTTRAHASKLVADGSTQLAAVDTVAWRYRIHLVPDGPHGSYLVTLRERPDGSAVERLEHDRQKWPTDLGVALDYVREAVRGAGA